MAQKQAGLLTANDITSMGSNSPLAQPISITWAGYEFLAESKNETAWRKTTSTVMAKTGAIGFELLKALLSAELRRQMGLP